MRVTLVRAVMLSLLAAIVVFCVVQDRMTAAAVGQYVVMKRAELAGKAGGAPPVSIESVMRPAVRRSVRNASLWALGTFVVAATGSLAWIKTTSRRRQE